jgi:hypothetical protein
MSRVRWSKGTSCAAIAPAFAVFPPPDENSSPIPLSRNSFDRKNHEPAGIPDLLKGHSVGVIIHSRIAQNRVLARIFHRLGAKRFYPGQEPSSSTTPQPPLNAAGPLLKNYGRALSANSGRSRRLDRICLAGRNPTRACARTAKRLWLPSVYVAGHESQERAQGARRRTDGFPASALETLRPHRDHHHPDLPGIALTQRQIKRLRAKASDIASPASWGTAGRNFGAHIRSWGVGI